MLDLSDLELTNWRNSVNTILNIRVIALQLLALEKGLC